MVFWWHLFLLIMSSANSDTFTSSFPLWIPFIYFCFLIAVARIFNTVLNKSGKRGHPDPVPDLRENVFSFSLLNMILAVGLPFMAFLMLRYVPFISTLLIGFIINDCWIVKSFFYIYWDDLMIFILWLVNVMSHIDLQILIHPCILG